MAYLAGNLHLNTHLFLISYHHLAAIGALVLFLTEGTLLGLSVYFGSRPS